MTLKHSVHPRIPVLLVSVVVAVLSLPAAGRCASLPREQLSLDAGWRFHLEAAPVLAGAVPVTAWQWRPDPRGAADVAQIASPGLSSSGSGWETARPGQDVFKGRPGFAWFRTRLPGVSGPGRLLRFERVDDNAAVYLNGTELSVHSGFLDSFDVPLDRAWKRGGPNWLAVLVQNVAGPGGITRPVSFGRIAAGRGGDPSQPGYNDASWARVHLPDDYVIRQRFTHSAVAGHGSLPTPPAWYRKTFVLPARYRNKTLRLSFEGVYRDARVYLNGRELGEHQGGYTGFGYDITRAARFGRRNILAVHVDPRRFEGWWYEGGGIYRHVWLTAAGPLHLAPDGTSVTTRIPEPGKAAVEIRSTLENRGPAAAAELVSTVLDDRGRVVARVSTPVRVPAGQIRTVARQVMVTHPRLWSLDSPHLYRLREVIMSGRHAMDRVDTVFGIRTLRFDPAAGFFLNGKHVEIQGTANHQDFAGVGIAVPDRLEYWRVARLRAMGCNAWRTAHNPPSPALLDACDRLGMLVMDENRHLGDTYSPKARAGAPYSDLSELASMVRRDRNHPSIILWSLCNEEGLQGTPEGARIFAAMKRVVRRYDQTRPVTCAMSGGWFAPGFRTVEDVMGVNYHTGIYDRFHQQFPGMPIFGSETANSKSTRGIYDNDRKDGWVSSYNLPESAWAAVANAPFMAGSFVWTGYDYMGEPNPYGWPDVNNNTGLMDLCGFPKDKYYYFRAWWMARPMVHLAPHWNWAGKEGQPIKVMAFSNCQRVELFLNGKSLGAQAVPRNGHLEWSVPYAPGTLMARGYNGPAIAATAAEQTTGAPAALLLKAGRTLLSADGEEMEPVEVDVVDSQGRIVPTASNRITFGVTGAGHVAGVGNGNPSDHDPAKANFRRAFNGKCMVLVGAGDRPGAIVLTARSPGLKSAVLRMRSGAAAQ